MKKKSNMCWLENLTSKYSNMFQKMIQVSIWKVLAYHFEYLGKVSLQKYTGKEVWKEMCQSLRYKITNTHKKSLLLRDLNIWIVNMYKIYKVPNQTKIVVSLGVSIIYFWQIQPI